MLPVAAFTLVRIWYEFNFQLKNFGGTSMYQPSFWIVNFRRLGTELMKQAPIDKIWKNSNSKMFPNTAYQQESHDVNNYII